MDPLTGVSAAAKALPALRELSKLRRRDEVRNILAAVKKTLESDHRVPEQRRDEVLEKISGLPLDPALGGALKELLDGNSGTLPTIEARASQLLRFGGDFDSAVVDAFIEAVRANVIAAKRDVHAALGTVHRELLTSTDTLTEEIRLGVEQQARETQQSEQRLTEAIHAQLYTGDAGLAAFSLITGSATLARTTPEVLRKLGEHDQSTAREAAEVLARDGKDGLAVWADQQASRLRERGSRTTSYVGRLLMSEGRFAGAERLFLVAAEDDADDPVRQLVRAANAARLQGDAGRSGELLDRARGLAPDGHAAIVLAELEWQRLSPDEMQQRLDGVMPATGADLHGFANARAQVALLQGRLQDADRALAEAEQVNADDQRVRELRALWHLQRAHAQTAAGQQPDSEDISSAETGFLSLRDEMRDLKRPNDSGTMLSRAAEVLLVARRIDDATGLLEEANHSERHSSAGGTLARQALVCNQHELALAFARAAPASDIAKVVEASVSLTSDDAELRHKALTSLDELLSTADEDTVADAALARALACVDEEPAEWSERAGEILAQRDARSAEVLRARAHLAKREFEQAEAILRRHSDHLAALDALIDSAAMQSDFETALQRSEVRLRQRPDTDGAHRHARLLISAGREADALSEFSKVARSPDALWPGQREDAFVQALELARRQERYAEMEQLAQEAIGRGITGDDLHWARALARFMLSRHAEALRDLDATGVTATTLPQAELLAGILYQAADPAEALARNAELSMRFGRPERLEALLIVMSPNAEQLDPQTEAAVQAAYETFGERFPNSKRIVRRELPSGEEGVKKLLSEMAPPARRDQEIVAGVRDGSTATAVLAAVRQRSLSEMWPALTMLPLGYGDPALDDLELQDARRTLASPAVLDPTSLSVLALLGTDASEAVLRALPGSQIPQASLQDADWGVNPMNDPRASVGAIVRDPRTGEPVVVANDAEDAERRAARQREHLRLAQALEVAPDTEADGEHELERALLDSDRPVEGALRTWAATLTLAIRQRRPVLSDDRRVRLYARAAGLPSFGTLALLRALAAAGDVPQKLHRDARIALLRAGGLGLHPDGQELTTLVREQGWQPSRAMYSLLSDPSFWEPDGIAGWRAGASLLAAIHEQSPDRLDVWAARLLDAAKQAKPQVELDVLCYGLLATVWGWTGPSHRVSRALLQDVVDVLRGLAPLLGVNPRMDPMEYALLRFAKASERLPDVQRALLALRAIVLLRMSDQLKALELLWE